MNISPSKVDNIDDSSYQLWLRDQLTEAEGLVTIKDISIFLCDMGNPRIRVETTSSTSLNVSRKGVTKECDILLLTITV